MKLAGMGVAVAVSDISGAFEVEGIAHDRLALLHDLVQTIAPVGGRAMAIVLDVSDPALVNALDDVPDAVDPYGKISAFKFTAVKVEVVHRGAVAAE